MDNKSDHNQNRFIGRSPRIDSFTLCRNGEIDGVREEIKNGMNVDAQDFDNCGLTRLYYACENEHYDVAYLLIQNGANVNLSSTYGKTPLLGCILHCKQIDGRPYSNLDIIKLLLENGAEISIRDEISGYTPFLYACHEGLLEAIVLMISYLPYPDNEIKTLSCYYSYFNRHFEVTSFFIENYGSVEINTNDQYTILRFACMNGFISTIASFIDKNIVDINSKQPYDGNTALHDACSTGNLELVTMLLNKKAIVNCLNNDGNSPLYVACVFGSYDVVELLLVQYQADMNTSNRKRNSLLHVVSQNGFYNIAQLIIFQCKNGNDNNNRSSSNINININSIDNCGSNTSDVDNSTAHMINSVPSVIELVTTINKDNATALHYAAAGGYTEICVLLLENGATSLLNHSDTYSYTCLHYACQKGYFDTVHLLTSSTYIDHIDVNIVDENLKPPLWYAVERQDIDIAKRLLAKNANPNLISKQGETMLYIAVTQCNTEMVSLLLSYGADKNYIDKAGVPLLHLACKKKERNIAILLIQYDVDLTLLNRNKQTALHVACDNELEEVVTFLLSYDMKIFSVDKYKCTPLTYASRRRNRVIMRLLVERSRAKMYSSINTVFQRLGFQQR